MVAMTVIVWVVEESGVRVELVELAEAEVLKQMPEAEPKHWTTLAPADPAAVVKRVEVRQGLEVREQALG